MKMTVASEASRTLVVLEERRLDAAIATRFKDRMREIVSKSPHEVMLDMQQVDFMDSSGLGAIIAVHKAMPEGVPLVLSDLRPNVQRVFKLTRMDSVFNITPPPGEAREAG